MPLSHTIRFDPDPKRQGYRVRFRGKGFDNTLNVPRGLFKAAGVDSRKASPKGQRIAERWAARRADEIEASLGRNDGQPMRLSDVAKLHERKNPGDVTESTKKRNREMVANLVRILEDPLPEEIDDALALEYRNARSEEKDRLTGETIRNRTIWNELSHLKTLLTWSYQWRRETKMRELRLFKLPVIRKQPSFAVHLRDEELARLFSAVFDHDTDRWRLIIAFGLVTLLRRKVLLGFREEWYDEARQWINIPAEAMKGAGGEKRPLSAPACDLAAEIIRRAKKLRGRNRSPYLFANHNGRPSKWPINSVRAVCEKYGIRYFSAHDLRRTGMTILDEAGVKTLHVARLAGHAAGAVSGAPRVTSSYIGLREEEELRHDVKHLDAFWEHLQKMSPGITLECAQDVTRGARKPRKSSAARAARKRLS